MCQVLQPSSFSVKYSKRMPSQRKLDKTENTCVPQQYDPPFMSAQLEPCQMTLGAEYKSFQRTERNLYCVPIARY